MALRGARYPTSFQPIYLHYLDRELRESLGSPASAVTLEAATRLLVLGTPAVLYCGLAPAWEGTTDSLAELLVTLRNAGQLETLSHHASLPEFIGSKRAAYKHDVQRYPMYFLDEHGPREGLTTSRLKRSSATNDLIAKLNTWSIAPPDPQNDRYYLEVVDKQLKTSVRRGLESRQDEAITFAMFKRALAKEGLAKNPLAVGHLRREISAEYVGHYLDEGGGDIATGIPNFDFFDSKARYFPLHDIELLQRIFAKTGLAALSRGSPSHLWNDLLQRRGGISHRQLAIQLRILIGGVCGTVPAEYVARAGQRYALRESLERRLQACRQKSAKPDLLDDILIEAIGTVGDAIRDGERDPGFLKSAESMKEAAMAKRERVLLVTATQVEIEHAVKIAGRGLVRKAIGDHTYYDLGEAGGCDILAVKCGMGSGGPAGSQATVTDAIRDVDPSAVVLVGIAFGTNREKQQLGDILLSRQLQPYELQRVGVKDGSPHIIYRGPRVDVPPRMIDRFESGVLDWTGQKVWPGLILSGEKLVDSAEFKEKLRQLAPEAVGGEMEGAGLYAAAYKEKIDWIVVKAIADWAEAKGDAGQPAAAENAVGFVFHVLSHGGLAVGIK